MELLVDRGVILYHESQWTLTILSLRRFSRYLSLLVSLNSGSVDLLFFWRYSFLAHVQHITLYTTQYFVLTLCTEHFSAHVQHSHFVHFSTLYSLGFHSLFCRGTSVTSSTSWLSLNSLPWCSPALVRLWYISSIAKERTVLIL